MEKPILFNTEMVQAILKGRKTVTRRIVKPKSKNAAGFTITYDYNNNFTDVYDHDGNERMFDNPQSRYRVGDILYVKETWQISNPLGDILNGEATAEYIYKAGYSKGKRIPISALQEKNLGVWKPSIHMPKEAARIFLIVTNVRVEKLQDITDEEALREGIQKLDSSLYGVNENTDITKQCLYPKAAFSHLWDRTIKKDDLDSYSFKANPWVWVIEFKVKEIKS